MQIRCVFLQNVYLLAILMQRSGKYKANFN